MNTEKRRVLVNVLTMNMSGTGYHRVLHMMFLRKTKLHDIMNSYYDIEDIIYCEVR